MSIPRLTFPRSHRLSSPLRFKAVYDARVRDTRGPLVLHSLPNELTHCRMGLSVSRRVGVAPRRNRIKRLLREAFRGLQHEFPAAYDLVIVVRPHQPLELADYRDILRAAVTKVHRDWTRRQATPRPDNVKTEKENCPS